MSQILPYETRSTVPFVLMTDRAGQFHDRTQGQKGCIRRVMIVALARKLAIALWRYLETGLIPEGAIVR